MKVRLILKGNRMERDNLYIIILINMMDFSSMDKNRERELNIIRMGNCLMGYGKIIRNMDKEYISIIMGIELKENGDRDGRKENIFIIIKVVKKRLCTLMKEN